jgi:hypothetical protein
MNLKCDVPLSKYAFRFKLRLSSKDRRGVTSQRVTVFKLRAARLAKLTLHGRGGTLLHFLAST